MSITVFAKEAALVDIEIWGAERRISLLEECLGVAITFSTQ
jgi:hypothetical protein